MPDLPDHTSRVHNAVVLRVCVFFPLPRQMPDVYGVFSLPRQMPDLPDPASAVQWCYVCVCFSPFRGRCPTYPTPPAQCSDVTCVCVFPPSAADARPTRPRQPGAPCRRTRATRAAASRTARAPPPTPTSPSPSTASTRAKATWPSRLPTTSASPAPPATSALTGAWPLSCRPAPPSRLLPSATSRREASVSVCISLIVLTVSTRQR